MQAVVLAGGLGTRLGEMTRSVPKPMVPVNGRPFLEYEIALLRRSGVRDLVLCVGYLGGVVEDYFGDGQCFGVTIRYVYDFPRLLGPAGALRKAAPLLEDSFLVTYGDAYLRMDYHRMMTLLLKSHSLGVMAVYKNNNRHGKSDLEVRDGFVMRYDKKNSGKGMVWINYGVTALMKKALELIPQRGTCGEEEFYGKLVARRELLAYPVRSRFYEIGTPTSLLEFEEYVKLHGLDIET